MNPRNDTSVGCDLLGRFGLQCPRQRSYERIVEVQDNLKLSGRRSVARHHHDPPTCESESIDAWTFRHRRLCLTNGGDQGGRRPEGCGQAIPMSFDEQCVQVIWMLKEFGKHRSMVGEQGVTEGKEWTVGCEPKVGELSITGGSGAAVEAKAVANDAAEATVSTECDTIARM
jgi:hypothetical protein